MVDRVFTPNSFVKPISPGLAIGPPACALRSEARPSQNWATFRLELSTVGALIGPCAQLWPIEVFRLSVPDIERRGSKYSCIPSCTSAGLATLGALIG